MAQVAGLPELLITLGRRRLSAAETSAVLAVRVSSALGVPAQCMLSWRTDQMTGRGIEVAPGDALRVEIGGHREPLFAGEVTVVEFGYGADLAREVRVRAYDALHRLRKRQSTRLHGEADLAGLVDELVADTGLSVVGARGGPGRVVQCARSDLATLVEACARANLYPVVVGSTLRLVTLAGEDEEIVLELGRSLHSAEVELSVEPAFRSAEVSGWTADAAESFSAAVDGGVRANIRADAAPASVGAGGALLRQNAPLATVAEARALAEAELDARTSGEAVVDLVTDGDPRLRPGRRVRVNGIAAALEGSYAVTSCVHTIDGGGYETALSSRPPAPPPPRSADTVTLGMVTDVDDPLRRGRVRVELPAITPLTTPWAPVLVAGAGAAKGAVFLPAPGDRVLVLLVAGDPGDAIVLGGLYGTDEVADAAETGDRDARFSIRTSDGQLVTLNGSRHEVRIENGRGSSVELAPDLVRISAASDLLIEAPGRSLRIRAKSVDFEEAP